MARPNVNSISTQLTEDEGEKSKVYKDSLGYLTIGKGRLVDPAKRGGGLSKDEIEYLFQNDLRRVTAEIISAFPWAATLSHQRMGVLLNMSFQMGTAGLMKFGKFLAYVRDGEYKKASVEMLDSLWAKQTPERADRLSKQMETDKWQ